jgi:DNA-binding CsgD family transcriptional regulator
MNDPDRALLAPECPTLDPPGGTEQRPVSIGPKVPRLSRSEIEVLELSSDGRSTKQLAYDLHVSPQTVNTLMDRARSKLDAATKTEAVAKAIRLGLLPP